jgi:hypothetical protein
LRLFSDHDVRSEEQLPQPVELAQRRQQLAVERREPSTKMQVLIRDSASANPSLASTCGDLLDESFSECDIEHNETNAIFDRHLK